MKLIVGLGNPGEQYKHNRHNVGFMFADYLLQQAGADSWKRDKYLFSDIAKPSSDLFLAKPQTYMNKSGVAVRKLMDNGKIDVDNLIVVHDDLDIPLGKFRIVKGYGPKLHNGIESIENHLHDNKFLRIRIGVDNRKPENRIPGIDYVLQNFSDDEYTAVQKIFPEILSLLNVEYRLSQ